MPWGAFSLPTGITKELRVRRSCRGRSEVVILNRVDAQIPAMPHFVVEAKTFEDVVEFDEIAPVIQHVMDTAAVEHQNVHGIVQPAFSTLQPICRR